MSRVRIPRSAHEHWLTRYERHVQHDLGHSGVTPPLHALLAPPPTPDPYDYGAFPAEDVYLAAIARQRDAVPAAIVATSGGAEALFLAYYALVGPGDTVLVERPTYFPLEAIPTSFGCRVEALERRVENGWQFDLDEVLARIRRGVKLVALANPNNPTGVATPPDALRAIAEACEDVGAYLLVDDIFRHVGPQQAPSHTLHPRIISADSLTKCHGLGGLRAGWLVAPPEVADTLRDARALTTLTSPRASQHQAAHALANEAALLARTRAMITTNLATWQAFAATQTLRYQRPDSALLLAVTVPGAGDDEALARRAIETAGVLTVPGRYFGAPGTLRIGLGTDPAAFAAALDALATAL